MRELKTLCLVLLGCTLLLGLPVLAFELKPVELGSPSGFTCHPSWAYFTADSMAADFTADRTRGDAPFTVNFYDISYGYPEYWHWDFGDGNTSEDQNPTHTYLVPGTYDVSLTIGKKVNYETVYKTELPSRKGKYNKTEYPNTSDTPEGLLSDFVNTGKGQLTDLSYSSTDRELEYITVAEEGSGTDQPVPVNFYPEPKNQVTLPSGQSGVVGSADFYASTVTITPDTQKGYVDSLRITGAYRLSKFTPYNDAF